jgi:hypothetical protein
MRPILTAALLLVGCASTPPLPPPYQPVPLSQRVAASVESLIGFGSAMPITSDCYLTAWHVVSITNEWGVVEAIRPELIWVNGKNVKEVIHLGEHDAAILVMEEPHLETPWRVDVRAPRPAEDVAASGWGNRQHWWSRGLATRDKHRVSVCVWPGDSGGAILDAEGDILGIIVAKWQPAHHSIIEPVVDLIYHIPLSILSEMSFDTLRT